jgi:hypothetical protein
MQAVYRSFLGDFALLDVGAHLAATATSNDNVRISDGVVAVQGIYAVIAYNEYDDSYIEPVSVGMKRIDTLILHYTKSNDIEDMQIEVVEGEEVVDNPVAPTIAEGGDAWEGTADIKVPIYDVLVTSFGLTVTPYSRMNTLIPTLDSIAERIPETVVTGVKGDSESLYRNGNVNITKANIGLGNVDNTADTDKPISTATQTALNLKADLAYVNAKIASVYHPGGSKTVAELTSALLIADNEGKVYNMSDSGVTTSDFVEGAGYPIPVGSNVEVFNTGTEESPVYKFDLLPGFVDLSAYATTSAVNAGLAGKVDKVAGKGLSTNDYTDTEKQKLANIESNAQANVQSDWNEDDTEDDGYIKNKPNLSTSLTATGSIITLTDASNTNLIECVAKVEAVQEGSGDPSPTNIRPIIGQTEANVWVSGKNLLAKSFDQINNVSRNLSNMFFIKRGTYIFSFDDMNADTWRLGLYLLDANGNDLSDIKYKPNAYLNWSSTSHWWVQGSNSTSKSMQFDIVEDCYIRVIFGLGTTTASTSAVGAKLEVGTTPTTYEPYNGQTYNIDLDGTRYGGKVDLVSGELTVDRVSVDLSTVSFTYDSTNKRWSKQFSDMKNYSSRSANLMFEQYEATISAYTGDTGTAFAYGGNIYIYDAEQSLTISGKCVYELATPITYQLTPQQIKLLKGTNNISCNTGDLSIKYYPDNVLGQLKGDIESEYDAIIQNLLERIEALENQQ